MNDPKNIESRTNGTFSYCGRYPTIMDGIVYRHNYTPGEDYSSAEVSASRNGITVDNVYTLKSRKQVDNLIDIIEKAWEEHTLLKGGREIGA